MTKFQATSTIYYISPVIEIPSKTGGQPFQKRELILDDSWEKDGQRYPNFVLVEFQGEKMQMLDTYAPGQRVNVEGVINGREYNGKYFNTVKGLSISPYQTQQYTHTPAYPQQPPAYPQAPAYPQQVAPQYVQQQPPQQQSQWIAPGVHQTASPQTPPVATGYPPMPGGNDRKYYTR